MRFFSKKEQRDPAGNPSDRREQNDIKKRNGGETQGIVPNPADPHINPARVEFFSYTGIPPEPEMDRISPYPESDPDGLIKKRRFFLSALGHGPIVPLYGIPFQVEFSEVFRIPMVRLEMSILRTSSFSKRA